MKTFKDPAGQVWTIDVTVNTVRRIKSLLGVNLQEVITGDLLERMSSDVILLVDMLYVACKDEADARGITDEKFGALLGGDVLESATIAFMEALINFFPLGRRKLLQKAMERMQNLETQILKKAEELLDSPDLLNRIESEQKRVIGSSSSSERLRE